ncbi:MAG: selenocysteine-specific translation elongation factor [Phenylobacterium sp.]
MTVAPPPPLGLAVIGHVNHGKTALVRALTGIETDRLPEEKARGLSIALGFAHLELPEGDIDFLDAPGHEDFIRAMVMGTAGARAALLVVSAAEGFGRQTREHLRIAGLLGLQSGLVAVTKADLAPEAARPGAQARLAAELAGSFLAAAPCVFCSTVTGEGLEALRTAILRLAREAPPPAPLAGAFLPLDRVFSPPGTGTVVTGSLQGAGLAVGDEAVLEPSGRRVHVRQLQVHGRSVPSAPAGGRVAAALRGVAPGEAPVGEVLCTPGAFPASRRIDVALALSPDAPAPLKSGDEVRVLSGARQDMARVRLLEAAVLEPGGEGLAQLRFADPVPVHPGQRLLLRRPSPAATLGGARVLDPLAPELRARTLAARKDLLLAAARRDLEGIASGLAARDGGAVALVEAVRLSRRPAAEVEAWLDRAFTRLDPGLFAHADALQVATVAYRGRLSEAHRRQPTRAFVPLAAFRNGLARSLAPGLIAHAEARLAEAGEIRLARGRVALAGHDPFAALSPEALDRLAGTEAAFRARGVSPPDPAAFDAELIALLVASGRMVSLRNHALRQTLVFHLKALDGALATLAAVFPPPAEFTTGQAREALSTSRKFIVPALEFLDARGDTARRGDVRRVLDPRNRFGPAADPL